MVHGGGHRLAQVVGGGPREQFRPVEGLGDVVEVLRQPGHRGVGQPGGDGRVGDGPQQGGPEALADLAAEQHRGCRRPPLGPAHGGLDPDDQRQLEEAEGGAQQQHDQRGLPGPGGMREQCEREQDHGGQRDPDGGGVAEAYAPVDVLAEGGGHGPGEGHRRRDEPGADGPQAEHGLGVRGDEDHRGDHEQAERAEGQVHGGDGAPAPDPSGNDRFLGPAFDPDDHGRQHRARAQQSERGRGQPGPGDPALHQREEQQSAAGEDAEGARPVDRAAAPGGPYGLDEVAGEHPQGEAAQGQVEEEDPAPVGVRGDESAERGARHGGGGPHGGHPGLDPRALLERVQVGGQGLHGALEGAAAQPLDDAEGDEGGHVPGEGAQQRADDEQGYAEEQDRLAAEGVGELPVDGEGDGDREQVAGEEPGEDGEPAEVADDLGDGGGDDGVVEGYEAHAQHEGGDERGAGRPAAAPGSRPRLLAGCARLGRNRPPGDGVAAVPGGVPGALARALLRAHQDPFTVHVPAGNTLSSRRIRRYPPELIPQRVENP